MPKFAVDILVAGKVTIDVEADDASAAYEMAGDALLCVLDGGNVGHQFEVRQLGETRVLTEEPEAAEEGPSP